MNFINSVGKSFAKYIKSVVVVVVVVAVTDIVIIAVGSDVFIKSHTTSIIIKFQKRQQS